MNIEKKYQLDLSTGIVAFSNNTNALEKLAESANMDYEGRIGWSLIDNTTGEVISFQKAGMDCTLADLYEMDYPSVRLYHTTLRQLVKITGRDADDARKNITMRDIREMVLGGEFLYVRNAGYKTRIEFYDMLIDFCGNTRVTRLAINTNIELHEDEWLKHNPDKDPMEYDDPAAVRWANLDSNYYKKFAY